MQFSIEELVARGGWSIEDPQERHDANPDTFWIPEPVLRHAVGPGSTVRLLLWFVDEDGSGRTPFCERMPVLVVSRQGDTAEGRLASQPLSAHAPFELGDAIKFRVADAIDVLDPTEDCRAHGVLSEAIAGGDETFDRYQQKRRDQDTKGT